ncbi:galactose ABC transporter substrate-binding protein [Bengtsoniella intestinalis]|uniref:galactose ABC transporter substrate-binding protein n=1 Tax=Bengtsoniella intestinalis TaxID=3073143 RepID=UPI00391F2CB7
MKKLFSILLAATMTLSLMACSSSSDSTTTTTETTATEAVDETVAEITAALGDADTSELMLEHFVYNFSDAQQNAVMNACKVIYEAAGINYNFNDGGGIQSTQNDQIDNAIQKGATMLVVGMADISSAQNVVDKAKSAGIPILFYNQQPDEDIIQSYDQCWFVGSDARGGGLMQGEMAATTILADYDAYDRNGDGVIQYVMIRSDLSHAEANGRTEAAVTRTNELFAEAGMPALEQMGTDYLADDWSTNKGKDCMDTFLTANPISATEGVELVFANNDSIAIGAIQALQTMGWNQSADKAVPVLGVDATDEAKTYIDAGTMLGSAGQDPELIAEYVATVAFNVFTGGEPLDGTDWAFEDGTKDIFFPYSPYPTDLIG